MMSDSTRQPATVQTLWIIHFAFPAAVMIYGIIIFMIKPEFTRPDLAGTVFWSLVIATLGLIVAGMKIPDLMESRQSASGSSAQSYLARRQSQMVVMDACLEAGAILGTAASFAGALDFPRYAILLGICFAGLIAAIPRISGWIGEHETMVSRERVQM